jgi:hypothetical protein
MDSSFEADVDRANENSLTSVINRTSTPEKARKRGVIVGRERLKNLIPVLHLEFQLEMRFPSALNN